MRIGGEGITGNSALAPMRRRPASRGGCCGRLAPESEPMAALMHFDQDAPDTLGVKGDRLDVRVDLGPLLRRLSIGA